MTPPPPDPTGGDSDPALHTAASHTALPTPEHRGAPPTAETGDAGPVVVTPGAWCAPEDSLGVARSWRPRTGARRLVRGARPRHATLVVRRHVDLGPVVELLPMPIASGDPGEVHVTAPSSEFFRPGGLDATWDPPADGGVVRSLLYLSVRRRPIARGTR